MGDQNTKSSSRQTLQFSSVSYSIETVQTLRAFSTNRRLCGQPSTVLASHTLFCDNPTAFWDQNTKSSSRQTLQFSSVSCSIETVPTLRAFSANRQHCGQPSMVLAS